MNNEILNVLLLPEQSVLEKVSSAHWLIGIEMLIPHVVFFIFPLLLFNYKPSLIYFAPRPFQ